MYVCAQNAAPRLITARAVPMRGPRAECRARRGRVPYVLSSVRFGPVTGDDDSDDGRLSDSLTCSIWFPRNRVTRYLVTV
ncbi:hypothetical protein EVAR_49257_1 [Eumeta japonica]|uniref:Uncharacterized protein n=1 Tax=Eumeta variegata TaxID=151549 RepID=A0A4C1YG05_EUMVA|nr:hypothetical protein EVAR_49257_1 [Eumeta japonica]